MTFWSSWKTKKRKAHQPCCNFEVYTALTMEGVTTSQIKSIRVHTCILEILDQRRSRPLSLSVHACVFSVWKPLCGRILCCVLSQGVYTALFFAFRIFSILAFFLLKVVCEFCRASRERVRLLPNILHSPMTFFNETVAGCLRVSFGLTQRYFPACARFSDL